jgi:hypothetical protein
MWSLWWIKLHWGRFSPSTSVYPATDSTGCTTLINIHHPGSVQEAGQWPTSQVDPIPPHRKNREPRTAGGSALAADRVATTQTNENKQMYWTRPGDGWDTSAVYASVMTRWAALLSLRSGSQCDVAQSTAKPQQLEYCPLFYTAKSYGQ